MKWPTPDEAASNPRLHAAGSMHIGHLDVEAMCRWAAARFEPSACRSIDPGADEAAWAAAGIRQDSDERAATTAPYGIGVCAFVNAFCLEVLGPRYRRLVALRVFMDKAYTEMMASLGEDDKEKGALVLLKQCDLMVSLRDVESDALKLENELFSGTPHALTQVASLSAEHRARRSHEGEED